MTQLMGVGSVRGSAAEPCGAGISAVRTQRPLSWVTAAAGRCRRGRCACLRRVLRAAARLPACGLSLPVLPLQAYAWRGRIIRAPWAWPLTASAVAVPSRPVRQYKSYFDKYPVRSPEPAVLSVPADTVVTDPLNDPNAREWR